MSDQGPVDPTRPQQPVGGDPAAEDPTSVMRPASSSSTTYETTTGPRDVRPVPDRGGVATGVAVGAAIVCALLGLLVGYLLFGMDDDDDVATDDPTTEEPVVDEDLAALVEERDELAQQVEEQQAQIEDLQSQLDEVTDERDELAEGQDDGDEVTTVPAPDLVGTTLDDAGQTAADNGWTVVQRNAAPEDVPDGAEPGEVVAQYPEPGTDMIEGSVIVFDVAPPEEG